MKTISGIFRKKALHILSSLAVMAGLAALTGGCYDDSYILDQLNQHELRIQALEKLCSEMNTNISSLQTIVTAISNNDFVTSITPVVENGAEVGYTITFSKSGPVTIYHGKNGKDGADGKDGKDGKDGTDGSTPVISVKQDADGHWYWTLDGEWLLDDNGDKVRASAIDGADGENGANGANGANGKDGITPKLKIQNDYWYISYDNGTSWKRLGKATGADGRDGIDGKDGKDGKDGTDGKDGKDGTDGTDGTSFFKSVEVKDTTIELTLNDSNSTKIILNRVLPLSISFYDSDLDDKNLIDISKPVLVNTNSSLSIYFEVTADAAAVISIDAVGSSEATAKVITQAVDKNRKGRIDVQIGSTVNDYYCKVSVFVGDGTTLLVKTIEFKEND